MCEQSLLGFAYENARGLGALAFCLILAITGLIAMWVSRHD